MDTISVAMLIEPDYYSNPPLGSQNHGESEEKYLRTIISMALHADSSGDDDTHHIALTSTYAEKIGRKFNLSEFDVQTLSMGGLLHDIGKSAIPVTILQKPGPLTKEEWDIMRLHPVIGVKILQPYQKLQPVLPIVLFHHERWDGNGYPNKLAGKSIPLLARIVTVIDAYTAMVLGRIYRKSIPIQFAIEELKKHRGVQFDGDVVDAFLEVIDDLSGDPHI